MSPDKARERFAGARVARLATADRDGQPHVVAVTFAVEGDSIFTAVDQKPKRTRALKRLANIAVNPRVALLADHYEDEWSQLWWARADGHAAVRDDHARALELLRARYPQYADEPPAGPVVEVRVARWSGWSAR